MVHAFGGKAFEPNSMLNCLCGEMEERNRRKKKKEEMKDIEIERI